MGITPYCLSKETPTTNPVWYNIPHKKPPPVPTGHDKPPLPTSMIATSSLKNLMIHWLDY